MRRTRPNTNRWNQERGTWRSRDLDAFNAGAAREEAIVPLRPLPELQRVVHPVVTAPERKCYRVIRLFRLQGHLGIEHIGVCANATEAMAISTTEQWRAQVIDPNDKVLSDNWQSMETR